MKNGEMSNQPTQNSGSPKKEQITSTTMGDANNRSVRFESGSTPPSSSSLHQSTAAKPSTSPANISGSKLLSATTHSESSV